MFKSAASGVDHPLVDILLDEAIERLTTLSAPLGFAPPVALDPPGTTGDHIELLEQNLAPLTLPDEVLRFWTCWRPETFAVLAAVGVGLHTIAAAGAGWTALRELGHPTILLPVGRTAAAEFAVELDAPGEPGSRLYRVEPRGVTSLIGVGVSDLLHLLAEVIGEIGVGDVGGPGGADADPHDGVPSAVAGLLDRVLAGASARYGDRALDLNRGSWPRHWLLADGFTEEWLTPRGATHTNRGFDVARRTAWPLTGVLQGVWRTGTAGPAGRVGWLTDDSGSVELLLPTGIRNAGQGPGDRCEMEVVGIPPADADPRLTAAALLPSASYERVEHLAGLLEKMRRAMDTLDTSVVALAVRPLY